jgi:hypothetical protein
MKRKGLLWLTVLRFLSVTDLPHCFGPVAAQYVPEGTGGKENWFTSWLHGEEKEPDVLQSSWRAHPQRPNGFPVKGSTTFQ